MIIIWTIAVIVVLFLVAGAIFLSLQVKKIKQLQYMVSESFWRRRNKIPLLIETARKADIEDIPTDEILDLSGRYLRQSYVGDRETLGVEDKLFGSLLDIFRRSEQNLSLISLEKEFEADSSDIKIALNDYRFARAELENYLRQPWFKIFKIFRFVFKIPQI